MTTAYFWKHWSGGKEIKTPLFKINDDWLLNIDRRLREIQMGILHHYKPEEKPDAEKVAAAHRGGDTQTRDTEEAIEDCQI